MSEEKFSKCEEGGKRKNVSVGFRMFGKKELKEKKKGSEKKNQSVFFGENFAKFVFTDWFLC